MEERLMELLDKEILTGDEYDEVEQSPEVVNIENCGISGRHVGCIWYSVTLDNGDEYDIYLE